METWERVELRGRPAFLIKSEGEVIIGELLAGSLCDPPGQKPVGKELLKLLGVPTRPSEDPRASLRASASIQSWRWNDLV